MHGKEKQNDRLRRLLDQGRIIRSKDLTSAGVHHEVVRRLKRTGEVTQIGRGAYISSKEQLPAEFSLALVSAKSPSSVICLISALSFHNIGTQISRGIWVAIPRGQRAPNIKEFPIFIVRYSGTSYAEGIETHIVAGISVKVYCPAKTVADCFKHRNKIGIDVAIEALRDVWRRRMCTMDDLWKYADICRVSNIMKPYLESLV